MYSTFGEKKKNMPKTFSDRANMTFFVSRLAGEVWCGGKEERGGRGWTPFKDCPKSYYEGHDSETRSSRLTQETHYFSGAFKPCQNFVLTQLNLSPPPPHPKTVPWY